MNFKSLVKATLATASVLSLGACGNTTSTSTTAEAKPDIQTEVSGETTITFWHALNGNHEKALTKLTEDFMAANPNIKVELQNQSSYKDLQAKINSTLTSPKDLPTITQAYPGWLWNAAANDQLVDVSTYLSNDKIGITGDAAIRPELLKGAQIEGVQYGIPFNKSTEVLFYNADLLKEYDVKVPTTLAELKEAAKTIYEKSGGAVVGAGFDSLNNYYATGMINKGVEFNKDLDLTSKESLETVNFYNDGIRAGYFRIAGSDKYLSGPFGNKQIAMYVGSTAGESYVSKGAKEGGYEYGVAARPENINIQQGTDIYTFASATDDQKLAAYLYTKFLVSADSQLYWAQQTGYLPVVQSVLNSDAYKNSDFKVPAAVANGNKQLFSIPVIENADSAYSEITKIEEKIYSDASADVQKVLEDSKAEFQSIWNQ